MSRATFKSFQAYMICGYINNRVKSVLFSVFFIGFILQQLSLNKLIVVSKFYVIGALTDTIL